MQTCLLTHLLVLCRRSPSLASVKSRLVLPFWYRLTWVIPDRGPLNVCVCVAGVGGVVGSCVVAWVRRRLRPVLQRVVPEVRYARCWQQRRRSGGDRRPPRRLQTKSVGVVVVFTVARTRSSTLPSTSAAELLVRTTATQRGQQRSVCHTATPSRRKNEPVFFCVRLFQYLTETRMHTRTRLMALCPGLPGTTKKVKPIWILLKQETMTGSGSSWATCKLHLAPVR